MIPVAAGALVANLITFTLIFSMWRLTKNEKDWVALGMCIICFAAMALIGLARPH